MDINDFLYRPSFLRIGLALSPKLPRETGYRIADYLAARIAAQTNSPTTRAIRANQWIANGENLTSEQLDQVVHQKVDHYLETEGCQYEVIASQPYRWPRYEHANGCGHNGR